MWNYEKRLQFPVKIDCTSPAAAKVIITQLGGPDGETAAAMRYLNQRYAMPNRHVAGLLKMCIRDSFTDGTAFYQCAVCLAGHGLSLIHI